MNFDGHPLIELDDLLALEEPGVIFEREHRDPEGVLSYVYTVAGMLRGEPIVTPDHATRTVKGALVGGDCIIVQAKTREDADALAIDGLLRTIEVHRSQAMSSAVDRAMNSGIMITTEARPRKQ